MSLSGDDGTKHDIKSSPPTIIIASFTCCGTSVGKIRISGFGLGQPDVLVLDTRKC